MNRLFGRPLITTPTGDQAILLELLSVQQTIPYEGGVAGYP
jgi:hypothetical protein